MNENYEINSFDNFDVLETSLDKKRKLKNKLYCSNCNKCGHMFKNCNEPITSYGIILFNINKDETSNMHNKLTTKFHTTDENKMNRYFVKASGINFKNDGDMENFCKYKNEIKFLLIQRKRTLGYVEFVRGRYKVENIDGIIHLFKQMTPEEIKKIGTLSFEEIWNDLWAYNKNKSMYQNEFNQSKQKYDKLKLEDEDKPYLSLNDYVEKVKPKWTTPEWGFPKGRRDIQEDNLTCGMREFYEETGFNDYVLLNVLNPMEEQLIGTNGVSYKHVYYIASSDSCKPIELDSKNNLQNSEVGAIGWFTFDEAIKLFRNHHVEKKRY